MIGFLVGLVRLVHLVRLVRLVIWCMGLNNYINQKNQTT